MPIDTKDLADTTADAKDYARIIEASPVRGGIKDALGKRRAKYFNQKDGDSRYDVTVPRDDARGVGILKEVTSEGRRLYSERSAKVNGRLDGRRFTVKNRRGQQVRILPENENDAARLGAAPIKTFVTSASRLHDGPDGMLWRDVAGYWVPTGRVCMGTPLDDSSPFAEGPQRDPSGNLWEQNPSDGEWTIRLYAEETP